MASCPNCGKKLHFWNMKAECPACKANIPNHNWEERLEADALERESAFYKMHSNLNKLKYSCIGTKNGEGKLSFLHIRLIRFIFCFLPIIGYVIPLGSINLVCSDGTAISCDSISAIALFTKDTFKFNLVLDQLKNNLDIHNEISMSFILWALSLFFGVLAFFSVPVIFSKFKQPVTLILHILSVICYSGAFLEFNRIGGDIAHPSLLIFVGILLFVVSTVLDIIVLAKPVKKYDGKYIPDINKDELQAKYAESIGQPYGEGDNVVETVLE